MTPLIRRNIEAVLLAYGVKSAVEILQLENGVINKTYRVETAVGTRYILQCLNSIFNKKIIDDIVETTTHLKKQGAEYLQLVMNQSGGVYFETDSGLWRMYHYIEAESFRLDLHNNDIYFGVGKLLSELHKNLRSLSYTPTHVLEGFHDKNFYTKKALDIDRDMYPEKLQDIVQIAVEHLIKYHHVPTGSVQIIHGDPRIENVLFLSHNKPYMFIDYDTCMFASIYIDIGDCLKSLMMLKSDTQKKEQIQLFINGYNVCNPDACISMIDALTSLKYATLESVVRYSIDSVEQKYFAWDSEKYNNAAEHNTVRVMDFWNFYIALQNET